MNCPAVTILVFLLVFPSVFSGGFYEHPMAREATDKLIETCKTKVEVSESDFQILKDHKWPESHEGLCLVECVLNETKIMKDGKYNKQGFIDSMKPLIGNDAVITENVEKLAESCENEIDQNEQDKCKIAGLVVSCIVKNAASYDLEIPGSG